jgi:hypothetical protein
MRVRVRWGNVGRVAAVVGIAALVVAWPRLGGEPPRLPPDAPVALGRSAPAEEVVEEPPEAARGHTIERRRRTPHDGGEPRSGRRPDEVAKRRRAEVERERGAQPEQRRRDGRRSSPREREATARQKERRRGGRRAPSRERGAVAPPPPPPAPPPPPVVVPAPPPPGAVELEFGFER